MTTPAATPVGLVLIAHGSPDPDWRRPLERVAALLGEQLGPDRVALAYLADAPHLDDALAELHANGLRRVVVIAALLSPGGKHVKVDIPAAVAAARERFTDVELELRSGALGDDDEVVAALAAASLRGLG
jgi:sirohydrochlorin cobaltochelatase